MKSKSNQNTIILASTIIVLFLGVLLYVLYFSTNHWNWNATYKPTDKNPYGASLFHELLQESNKERYTLTLDSLCRNMPSDPSGEVDNYIFLGERAYIDSADAVAIIDFIKNGNNAFFICENPSNRVVDSLVHISYANEESEYLLEAPITDEISESTEPMAVEDEEYYDESEDELAEDNSENYHVDTVLYYNDETGEQETLFVDTSATVTDEEYEEEYEDEYVTEETYVEPDNVGTEWYNPTFLFSHSDSLIDLQLTNKKLPKPALLSSQYEFIKYTTYWKYLSSIETLAGDTMQVLGRFNDSLVNFVRLPIGAGFLYIHTTPLAFTNMPLSSDSMMAYAQNVSTYFGKGKIYWDEENRNYDSNAFKKNQSDYDEETAEGPLEFILSEPSLRTAWYFILLAILLYVFFGAKRKQRIIPVTERMENTSIEYAEVISQLFMRQKDHKSLVKLKADLFKVELRERYGLRVPLDKEDENEEWFVKVSQKTGVKLELVKRIYERIHYFANTENVDTEQMLRFHHYLEEFNATAR